MSTPPSAPGAPSPAEAALEAARGRGTVDEELLAVLRVEPLLCAAEEVADEVHFSIQDVRGFPAALAWTSSDQVRAAGWDGPVLRRTGREVATLLLRSPVALVLNPAVGTSLVLQPPLVSKLARG
ncbi:hypothetical protein CLV92_10318 [Kineococcus xinjiangensis]|uniref:Type III secretion system (T3SS) SseB-like protein n=1 Tax=Kineococcus xinjiangensis TaxID=512762 RepID=A0A2S6ITD1_9ACTN|nr:SseB family protein [Kineococcus xinjiangensis]PPK97488.1 hypothetical protein CLV92_10318 [Kineococcus xinjiangensis]